MTNDGGGWLCQFADNLARGQGIFFTPYNDETVTCVGSGDYEGLTAVVITDWTDFEEVTIRALITPAAGPSGAMTPRRPPAMRAPLDTRG
ncbi:MAG: hypothetical protein R3C32_04485 [Chloroflexota bacterium]